MPAQGPETDEEGTQAGTPFPMPVVHHNAAGWGPTSQNLPAQFVDMPYAPFGKGDRLGRAADFTMSSYYAQKQQKYHSRRQQDGDLKNDEFQYKYDAVEDQSFRLVDTAKSKTAQNRGFSQGFKKPWQQGRGGSRGRSSGGRDGGRAWGSSSSHQGRGGRGGSSQGGGSRGGSQGGRSQGRGSRDSGRGRGQRRDNRQRVDRQASVKVAADWVVVEEFDLAQLTTLSTKAPEAEDLAWAGELATYNETYDRCSTKNCPALQRMENVEFYYVSTTDDPAVEKFAEEQAGQVYGTDAIFSLLMASPRSVYPWDVVVQKLGGALVFDKRDTAAFDFLTVSETSHEPPQEPQEDQDPKLDINSPEKLSIEATMINQNFSQQILRTDVPPKKMELPNPFGGAGDASSVKEETQKSRPAAVAYRYRKFKLGETTIVARTELHGLVEKQSGTQHMTAYALNEWDSRLSGGVDWRQKIDQQRGAVLATELKNNSCKLARWTAQSILAGADVMKLGYVSRVGRSNPYEHVVLATQFYKPKEFANQITLNLNNMWGIVKMLVDLLFKKDDGKFVIARDANKPIVRIYSVPPNTFDDDDDDQDDNQLNQHDDESSDED